MYTLPPTLLCDFYKISHRNMYPPNTQKVYSTWTPRTSRIDGVDRVVVFGQQAFIKRFLIDYFKEHFFNREISDIVDEYKRVIKYTLGAEPDTTHIEELWKLGYLPLEIKALPEGIRVPIRVPCMSIINTDDRFAWLTNYIESLASCELWQASTSATIAYQYRQILDFYAERTGGDSTFVPFQGHDFSFRGMSSLDSAVLSGIGHLLSFVGTDTIPAILGAEMYYNADIEKELIGTSIPATEHSIQCAYGDDTAYFKRLINEVHPSGFVSIVSDGYDFWKVIEEVLPTLKDDIVARDGKLVIRPDSGDPVEIICGTGPKTDSDAHWEWTQRQNPIPDYAKSRLEYKGLIECLWDTFGGAVNEKGYKVLDSHIGAIYGDSITLDRADRILDALRLKGFASTNIVFGIGSYTYQYNTRDTFGWAMKSTFCIIDGKEVPIFKDPKTDSGVKKSQKGVVAVVKSGDSFECVENLGYQDYVNGYDGDLLWPIFCNGELLIDDEFSAIRERLHS